MEQERDGEYTVARSRTVFSRVFPSHPYLFPATLQRAPARHFAPFDLRSCSLRYPCTLRSRTHVVRMHTRAYIRRVLRKLAPYASIQISHLATCVPTLSELPYVCPRAPSAPLSVFPVLVLSAFLFLCLTLLASSLRLTGSYHSLIPTRAPDLLLFLTEPRSSRTDRDHGFQGGIQANGGSPCGRIQSGKSSTALVIFLLLDIRDTRRIKV